MQRRPPTSGYFLVAFFAFFAAFFLGAAFFLAVFLGAFLAAFFLATVRPPLNKVSASSFPQASSCLDPTS